MECLYKSRHSVRNAFDRAERVDAGYRSRGLTADTRATVDGVLDSRTMLVLRKFRSAGHIDELGGAISTGKEANVYSALAKVRLGVELGAPHVVLPRAVKIFKTSILVFKNRRQYVEGEFRFRRGYASSTNPRKMVRQWAEKEFRNLRRMYQVGIRGPVPICLRGHAFVMSMIGKDDTTPAPRLRDYPGRDVREWKRVYIEVLALMRVLYQKCELVHGDLSEYNILFHEGHPYIIDVSQATDDAHVHAEPFLKRDCLNVASFFQRKCNGIFEYERSENDLAEVSLSDSELESEDEVVSSEANASDEGLGSDAEPAGSDEASAEEVADDSDGASSYDEECETTPNRVRFRKHSLDDEESKFLRGPSALNRWKWDAALAEKNAWNELDAHMSADMLQMLDTTEVMSVENTFNFIKAKSVGEHVTAESWPVFDSASRKRQWELVSSGQRILNNPTAEQDDEREVVDDKRRQLQVTLKEFETANGQFRSLCALTLRYVNAKNGSNEAPQTETFINTVTPITLHELGTIEVERELAQIERGQPSKYTACLAEARGSDDSDNEPSSVDDSASSCSDQVAGAKKFDGNIPAGMDPKEWKKQVKEMNRERRRHKLKKKEKKRRIKRSQRR